MTIRRSSAYYARYGAQYTVKKLAWSGDCILDTCNNPLRDKIREGLIDVSSLELGGPLMFKLMIFSM